MFQFLRSENWSAHRIPPASSGPQRRRSLREQAAQCAEGGDLAASAQHLSRALKDAAETRAPRKEQIALLLDLVEVQRKLAAPELAQHAGSAVDQRRAILSAAERSARSAIAMATASEDPDEFVMCLIALSDVFQDAHDWAAVEKAEREALRMAAASPHPNIECIAARTHRLACALHHLGHKEEAARLLERSIDLHEKRYGAESLEIADVLTDCGAAFHAQGNHARAKQCLRRALRIHQTLKGADDPETIDLTEHLARLLEESGDLDGAAVQYERALQMKMRKLGAGNLEELAEMQYRLATLHISWGNLARARELLEESVGEFRRHGGPRLAVALETLGQVEESLGHYNAALEELERAGHAWEKCGPARTAELIRNLDYRADLLEQLRRSKDAAWLRERIGELQGAVTGLKG